jgi:hypothetical protein
MTLIEKVSFFIQSATLIALIIYVAKTWEMASATRESARISELTLQEMKDARDQEVAPYVLAYFDVQVPNDLIEFVVKNNGRGIATDIQIVFDPAFKAPPTLSGAPTNEELMKVLMPEGKITSLPPNHEIRTIISSFSDYEKYMHYKDGLPGKYKISVTYHGGLSDKARKAEYISDIEIV